MLAELDKYGTILFKDFQSAFGAAFVASFEYSGFFFGVARLMLESDSVAKIKSISTRAIQYGEPRPTR